MKIKILLLLMTLTATAIVARAEGLNWDGFVSAKTAHVYDKPDLNSERLRTLSVNIKVKVIDSRGTWYRIDVDGKQGWTPSKNITITSKSPGTPPGPPTRKPAPHRPAAKPMEQSQSTASHSIRALRVGAVTGINISSNKGSDLGIELDSRTGIRLGACAILPIENEFYLHAELLYDQRGFMIMDSTYKIDYLSIPVYLRYEMGLEIIKPYLILGAIFAYNSNAAISDDENTYLIDDIKEFDISISFGAGAVYQMSQMHSLFLDIRYQFGTSTIHDKSVHDMQELDVKHNVLSFSLGYLMIL